MKKTGDGFMAVFEDPADGVAAAVAAQLGIGEAAWPEVEGGVASRMGVHTGPAETHAGDYVGPTVNRAARLEAAGHGGQILVSAATEALAVDRAPGIVFRDLGEHHLRGLARPERVFQVTAAGLVEAFPPLRTESIPSNVPAATGPIIGRERELEQVTVAMGRGRLVTITGTGGAGKTTLGLEVARRVARGYPAGVWLVELAGLSDGRRIATEVLGTIRHPARADRDSIEVLVEALRGQRMLLVLDNCEHLRAELAALVARVLAASEQLVLLATSRIPLGVRGEQVWRIPTLTLPDDSTVESVEASAAGTLFTAYAMAADAGFTVTEDNASVVTDVCRRLDGLPLAIELACARLRSMSVEELDRRLDDRFRVLKRDTGGDDPRHQTLRDTIMWSYELLGTDEQRLFRRLSVFVGGFDLEAAESIGAGLSEDTDVLDLLDHLVAQSLVQHRQGRYRMLETIRQLGVELLDQHNESEKARRDHLAWLTDLARRGGRELEGRDQLLWLRRFRAEISNIRVALSWAMHHDPVSGAAAAGALTRFFWMNAMEGDTLTMSDARSFLAEGYDLSVALLDTAGPDLPTKTRARLQSGIGGMLCVRACRYREGVERLAEAQALFTELGDDRGLGWAFFYDGVVGWGLRPIDDTVAIFKRALATHGRSGDQAGALYTTLLLGSALGVAGEHEAAREYTERFAEAADAIKVPNMVGHASEALVSVAWRNETGDRATQRMVESLEAFRQINNYACMTHALGAAAILLARMGDPEATCIVVGITQAIRERLNMVIAPYEDHTQAAADSYATAMAIDLARSDGALDSWEAAVAQGRTMEPDEGIDWTIRRLGHEPAPR